MEAITLSYKLRESLVCKLFYANTEKQVLDLNNAICYLGLGDRPNFSRSVNYVSHKHWQPIKLYMQTLESQMHGEIDRAKEFHLLFLAIPEQNKFMPKGGKSYDYYNQILLSVFDYLEGRYEVAKVNMRRILPELKNPTIIKFFETALERMEMDFEAINKNDKIVIDIDNENEKQQIITQPAPNPPYVYIQPDYYANFYHHIHKKRGSGCFLALAIIFALGMLPHFFFFVVLGDVLFPAQTINDTMQFTATVSHIETINNRPRIYLEEYDFTVRLPYHMSQAELDRVFILEEDAEIVFSLESRLFNSFPNDTSHFAIALKVEGEILLDIQEFLDREQAFRRERMIFISIMFAIALTISIPFMLLYIKPWRKKVDKENSLLPLTEPPPNSPQGDNNI